MTVLEACGSELDQKPRPIRTYFQASGVYVFLIAVTSIYYLLNASLLLCHFDLGWHLAAGDLIRERGSVPFQDPWAFTLGDRQWFNLSWLWDVMASILVQYTGFGGLTLSVVACGAIIVGYLTSLCLSKGASALATCIAVLSACVLYPAFATPPNVYLAAAPNTATMLFSVIFYAECLKRTRLFLLPAMMVLWVNLHGGFPLGLLILGTFCGIALLKRDWTNFKTYALVSAGCFAAIFVNPLGWHIYDGVRATLGHFVQGYITEWESFARNATMPGSIPGIIWISLFVVLELLHRTSRPVPIEARLLAWLFLFLGFYQYRYMSFFFLFSALPISLHIEGLLPNSPGRFEAERLLLAAGIFALCALPLTFMHVRPGLGLTDGLLSDDDARYLQANFSQARILNHWNVGGALIFRTRGRVPVFVDGRAATAYPDSLLRDYLTLPKWEIDEAAWDHVIEKYRIDAVFWPSVHDVLKRFLVDKRGWKEQYVGLHETLYVKP
ncbi:MAG TPA: hypothetical protein VFL62_00415 [Bradyrhizobium sp.]|uniref:hypothetical protein n=1 Tax=Bradyrhizobium sp. TaxID=376 RepID=UPI002D7FA64B|nr:hypothetical protein [Bradyrhizobium sp.]HET7884661.1 hypothetical protein [Bradyrhizobium sp.]